MHQLPQLPYVPPPQSYQVIPQPQVPVSPSEFVIPGQEYLQHSPIPQTFPNWVMPTFGVFPPPTFMPQVNFPQPRLNPLTIVSPVPNPIPPTVKLQWQDPAIVNSSRSGLAPNTEPQTMTHTRNLSGGKGQHKPRGEYKIKDNNGAIIPPNVNINTYDANQHTEHEEPPAIPQEKLTWQQQNMQNSRNNHQRRGNSSGNNTPNSNWRRKTVN